MATRHQLQICGCFSPSLVYMPVSFLAESPLILMHKQFSQSHHGLFPRHCLPCHPCKFTVSLCAFFPPFVLSPDLIPNPMAAYCSWLLLILLLCPLPPNFLLGGTSLSQILPYPLPSPNVSDLPIEVTPLLSLTGWCTMPVAPSPWPTSQTLLCLAIHHLSPASLEVKTEQLFNCLTFPSDSSSVTSCLPKHKSVSSPFWPLHPSHQSSSHSFLALSSPYRKMYSNHTLEWTFTLPCLSKCTHLYLAKHYPELFSSNCVLDAPLPCI